jgi:hypothetical protein
MQAERARPSYVKQLSPLYHLRLTPSSKNINFRYSLTVEPAAAALGKRGPFPV